MSVAKYSHYMMWNDRRTTKDVRRRTTNMNWSVIMGYYYVLFAIVLCAICYDSHQYRKLKAAFETKDRDEVECSRKWYQSNFNILKNDKTELNWLVWCCDCQTIKLHIEMKWMNGFERELNFVWVDIGAKWKKWNAYFFSKYLNVSFSNIRSMKGHFTHWIVWN